MYHVYNLQLTLLQAFKEILTVKFSQTKKKGGVPKVKLGMVVSLEFKITPLSNISSA